MSFYYRVMPQLRAASHRASKLAGRGGAGTSREPTSSTDGDPFAPFDTRADEARALFDDRREEFARATLAGRRAR